MHTCKGKHRVLQCRSNEYVRQRDVYQWLPVKLLDPVPIATANSLFLGIPFRGSICISVL
jgi:hypothetical protein